MAKKVQLMTNPKQWQVIDGVEVLVDVPQEDLDPITDSGCVEIEGHRTLEETISQENMFTPQITETKIYSKVGGVYHDNVVDGAYEEAILYGNTQVNLVESVTSGSKYIPHSFTSFQGNESKIGFYHGGRTNQVAPLVKGVTMVNLCQETSATFDTSNSYVVENVKGNTTYTVFFNFTVKNTNAGIIIQSYNGNTYLENSIHKTQLGDKVKFTFTTHSDANRFSICNPVAYGGETIQLDNIMVIEGDVTDLDLPFFKGMRSVELSRPLTNLFTDSMTGWGNNATCTNSGGQVVVTSSSVATWTARSFTIPTLKPNTQYLVMWDSLSYTHTSSSTNATIAVYNVVDGTSKGIANINNNSKCPTVRSLIFDTTGYETSNIQLRIHATTSNSETGITTVTGLRVFEWDDSLRSVDLQSLGYFSGTKYVSVRALETEGKNLYPYGDINFTSDYVGWCDAKGKTNMYGDIAQKSSTRFLLKKGTYTFSVGSTTNIDPIYFIDDKEQQVSDLSAERKTFTLTQDTYCTIRVKTKEANVATTVTNIQIERGETATTYEAYQSRYYKPRETEEIILRSLPNGVCDTFNLQTGELVQNIGETVLDGSSDESWYYLQSTQNTLGYFRVIMQDMCINNDQGQIPTYFINDKHNVVHYNRLFLDKDVPNSILISSTYSTSALAQCIFIYHNGIGDMTSFKTWLQQNPITVQYQLTEPIITKLQAYDRIYSGQTNALVSMSNNLSALTYYSNNYYLKVGNLSPVTAILEPITTIPYDVRLKPSTLYTIKYNRGGYSNSMKFDLGGSVVEKTNSITSGASIAEELTVKTPAILSHEQLILSGTGYAYNFIIVEGDITGTELPYFEGMKDVKMPIVKNVGKNLLNESSMRVFYESGITLRTYDVFPCKPNTRYCFVSVGGEISCNWHVCKKDAHYERPENESVGMTQYLGYSREIVTPKDCYYMCIHTGSNPTTDREVYDIKTAIYEGSFAECASYGYEDYKENSVYAVQGEYPITSEMIEQGGFSASLASTYETMKNDNVARLRSKDLIPVKPNTTYAFAHPFSKFAYNVYQWDGNKKFIDGVARYFADGQIETITTTADTQYIHFLISKHDASQAITISEYDWSQFHMYELDSTINLRSLPNGVKDELNLLTGEYIQRVGEVIIDGSQTLQSERPNHKRMYIVKDDMKKLQNYSTSMVCDKFNVSMGYSELSGTENTWVSGHTDTVNLYPNRNWIYFNIENVEDVSSMTTYLQSNPITVQYELAEPITSHVRLVSNNQEREVGVKLPNGVCNTYNPSTGITTVRVGKIVLDGSESWYFSTTKTNTQVFGLTMSDIASTQNNLYCETMRVASGIDAEIIATNGGGLFIALLKTKASTVDELKTYLASNPVTVWYELKYPQIQPDIVLPNGVHDEYNPETGVYTKKVDKIEFDGSSDEEWRASGRNGEITSGNRVYYYNQSNNNIPTKKLPKVNVLCVCDKLASEYDNITPDFPMCVSIGRTQPEFRISIPTASSDVTQCKQWLQNNPITVWYELETPITYQLTPYFGLPQPYAYENGYLIHESAYPEATLPPEFSYKLVANRTGQVMQNSRKLQEHTTRLSNLEAIIIEATIESIFNRELQLFELELMDIQLIDLGE